MSAFPGEPRLHRVTVLLAEDNESDIELVKLALAKAAPEVDLQTVRDGEEALAFLRKEGAYVQAPTPSLVLLDLRMPRISGLEVLAAIAADARLSSLPVVMLTTSAEPADVNAAYQLRCGGYLQKPASFAGFLGKIEALAEYWLRTVVLPR